jgi:2,5-diketo-D-gluconate reductase B
MNEGGTANGIPVMGLGTYGRTGEAGTELIAAALALGCRHLDTAQSYGTEANVGEAIRRSGIPRDQVFITTKAARVHLARPAMLDGLAGSLERLGTDRIDLTLIHWPAFRDEVPFEHYIEDLAIAQQRGWTRLIGVSNFPIALIDRAEALLGPGRIATNQVEVHPYLQNARLRRHCRQKGIAVTAYMPLAQGRVAADPVLAGIGARRGATPAQVALAFLLAEGLIVIPATSRAAAVAENLGATAVRLEPEDMEAIRALERNGRIVDPPTAPAWDEG